LDNFQGLHHLGKQGKQKDKKYWVIYPHLVGYILENPRVS
jgi:hypothetical protein